MMQNVIDEEIIKSVILQGLQQVDDSLVIDNFTTYFDKSTRKLSITFTARNQNGESITIKNAWG